MRGVVEWTRGPHCGTPRGVCRREWSGVRCRDLPEDGRIAQYPLQKVEQDRGHHGGLSGIVEPHGINRRRWGRVVAIITICQGMMELHGIHRRKWSRIVVVAVSRLEV